MAESFDLKSLAAKSPEEIFSTLRTSRAGLTSREAAKRRQEFGPNEFRAEKKIQPILLFFSKFRNPLLILLLAAAIISGFLGSPFDSIVIVVIVIGSTLIDFLNTYKSGKAAEKLKERVNVTAAISRDGEIKERKIGEVVPGDVFLLAAGDLVPADSVLIESKDMFVNEGILTGESLPAEKFLQAPETKILYLGTSVVSGRGFAVAVRTGASTEIGKIADKLKQPEPVTEFDRNIKDFSIFIFRITILLVLAIILLNIFFEGRSTFEIFLFAVAIAVGLTPELLPMIITANLAKGALKMSRSGVIVKKLSAIHNFGSIDILCTDKTGTLTEDRIDLVKCVDGMGNPSDEVLFWGYLGTVHLTHVRDVLDRAIQDYAAKKVRTEKGEKVETEGWEKVDEIPFDSVRKRDSVAVRKEKETVLVTKGAPEELFKISDAYGQSAERLTTALRKTIADEYEKLSADGFRVLAVATKPVPSRATYEKNDETGMVFRGFLAFLDPAKKSAKETIRKMREHNVDIKIITGDNYLVTTKIARDLNLEIKGVLTIDDLAGLGPAELRHKVESANIFTRVTPELKQAIIRALRENGHVVGYLGDGVNDALSLKEADVGISVNNAVDIAKDTADIILLRKGLRPVIEGVVEGRKTFASMFKYLMMALSSNFGNMFSMPIASLVLPFLPMTASQILLNNFLYDSSQLAIPFDNVDASFLKRAKKFDLNFMKKFMIIFGPLSSCFDFATFAVLSWGFGFTGHAFQTGWFLESIATQTLVVNVIRSRESFFTSLPGKALAAATVGVVLIGWILPATGGFAVLFGFIRLGAAPLLAIIAIVFVYLFAVEFVKKWFYAKYGGLIER
ncbi:MAG TPA: magnesium-translocating P-type ATPase [Candidatus Paceibacterota bacterium]|nr:magnesium-translocating P-type ATPase [Candidatus Paceibacterota bacterium]